MTTEKRIQIIVERNLPLDPTCETKRKAQMLQRIQLRLQFEELLRELKQATPYNPVTNIK